MKHRVVGRPEQAPVLLVVDDNHTVRQVLDIGLRRRGFDVRLSASGPEAVDVYRSSGGSIKMVLLDVLMPGRDGVWTLSALRSLDPRVQACFLTGDAGLYSEQELLDLRVQAVFHKPVNLGELADQLSRLMGRDGPGEEWASVVPTTSHAGGSGTAADPAFP
jgi:two-component system OmpR family response regulator